MDWIRTNKKSRNQPKPNYPASFYIPDRSISNPLLQDTAMVSNNNELTQNNVQNSDDLNNIIKSEHIPEDNNPSLPEDQNNIHPDIHLEEASIPQMEDYPDTLENLNSEPDLSDTYIAAKECEVTTSSCVECNENVAESISDIKHTVIPQPSDKALFNPINEFLGLYIKTRKNRRY